MQNTPMDNKLVVREINKMCHEQRKRLRPSHNLNPGSSDWDANPPPVVTVNTADVMRRQPIIREILATNNHSSRPNSIDNARLKGDKTIVDDIGGTAFPTWEESINEEIKVEITQTSECQEESLKSSKIVGDDVVLLEEHSEAENSDTDLDLPITTALCE